MERRKYHRAPLAFPIRLRISDISKFTDRFTADLSAGGIFLEMNSPLPVGTVVDIEFYLEPARKTIAVEGKVAWAVAEGEGGSAIPGMGIQFVDLRKDAQRFIELLVEKYKRAHPDWTAPTPAPAKPAGDPEVAAEPAGSEIGAVSPAEAVGTAKPVSRPQAVGTAEPVSRPQAVGTAEPAPSSIPGVVDPSILAAVQEEKPPEKMDLHVLVRFPEDEAFNEGLAHTLDEGEIFIPCDKLRPAGTRIFLQLFLAEEEKWVPGEGMVLRAMYSSGTATVPSGPGVAVCFSDPTEEFQRALQ